MIGKYRREVIYYEISLYMVVLNDLNSDEK